jgi:murein DD-endopeptidase MepM/ murein hydrolase activator NlpD
MTMKNPAVKVLTTICAVGVLGATLVACAPEFNPPPDYKGGFLWESDKSRTITVAEGDTIYTIARRYDVPSKVIIARNGLTPPYALAPGQTLVLDATRTHTVVRGDTLSQLAVKYNVEMRLLASANELSPPYVIRVGQELWIPDPFTIAAAPAGPNVVASAEVLPPVLPPNAPRVPTSAIQTEALPPPPGTQMQSPGVAMGTPGPVDAPISQPMTPPTDAAAPPAGIEAPIPSAPVAEPESESQVALAPLPLPLSEPPARASSRFSWPLQGKILAGFGSAGKGLHNDGINIAAPAGTQVRAADNGVVAYAGNELKGFGNLLLIKHADGWTTAYAHNQKLLVARGDEVKQGQVIAVVGRTGNVDSPQLHFEVRKGTQAMDPMAYLSK